MATCSGMWTIDAVVILLLTRGFCRAVESEAEKNFDSSVASPFNSCMHQFSLVRYLINNLMSAPTTQTTDDGMLITYKEVTLDIRHWRTAIKNLLEKATKAIDRICYNSDFGLKRPTYARDDWSNMARGYSGFKTQTYLTHKLALFDAMLHDESIELAKPTANQKSIKIDFYAVQRVMSDLAELNVMLAILVFFLCGQPSRAAEFVDCKITNSNHPHWVFLDAQGTVWIVVRRVKWESVARREVFLPKKCPPQLSELLKKYILIVRPVKTELARLSYEKGSDAAKAAAYNYSTFLWVQKSQRMTSAELGGHIAKFLQGDSCKGGNISSYRNFAVEISRIFFPPNFNDILYNRIQRGRGAILPGQQGIFTQLKQTIWRNSQATPSSALGRYQSFGGVWLAQGVMSHWSHSEWCKKGRGTKFLN